MLVVRPVKLEDIEDLYELIRGSAYGLTTLKISKEQLLERVEQSVFSFGRSTKRPAGQLYVFVLEDVANGKLVGTCAIYSKVGGFEPFYAYRIVTSVHESEQLNVRKEVRALHLMKEHNGPTEIGSLYLSPDYRGGGQGRLLSISRFMFMAEFPERFDDEVLAEMRGRVDDEGNSPFWEAIGAHFFEIEFPQAEVLTTQSKNFIADLMPTHPIYIPLLPEEAQETLGVVHQLTEPALAMLQKEGFEHRELIDIFDGGPVVHCDKTKIRAVSECAAAEVRQIVDDLDTNQQLISNTSDDFRVCFGNVSQPQEGKVDLDRVVALTLNVKVGDRIRFVAPRP